MLRRIKEILVNWLLKNVIIQKLVVKSLRDIGNTAYLDLIDFDHKTSDPSATESQMWYNSTDHMLRYRNDTETVDVGKATLVAEAQSVSKSIYTPDSYASLTMYRPYVDVAPSGSLILITKTDTFSADSMAVAGCGGMFFSEQTKFKLRLFMGGVQVAESALIPTTCTYVSLVGDKALSGSQVVRVDYHNTDTSTYRQGYWYSVENNTTYMHPLLIVGSVKQ